MIVVAIVLSAALAGLGVAVFASAVRASWKLDPRTWG